MDKLEQALGYCFKDRKFLTQALTHSSFTSDIHLNYERLEFLGDRILGVTIAEMLCDTFRDEKEGDLAQRFVRLVCKETVAEVVRQLNIEKYIRAIGQGVCQQDNVLCDIGEALIAAIYLDSGDLNCARQFIFKHWQSLIDKKSQPFKDYKTFLQEQAAILKLPQPCYQLVEKNGPEHAPTFVVCLSLGEKIKTLAKGHSKKQAEQNAAEDILRKLNIHV